jgi:putative oxidoreductase
MNETRFRFRNAVRIAEVLLAIFFAINGARKLLGTMDPMFVHWGYPAWFARLIGCAELGGAALLVLPPTELVGAGVLASVMLGAIATHLVAKEGPRALLPLLLLGLIATVAHAKGHARVRPDSA